jgi:hypothetical protein
MTFVNRNQINWKSKMNRRDTILLILTMLSLFSYVIYKEIQRDRELELFHYSWAIIINESNSRNGRYFYVKYYKNGKKIESSKVPVEGCDHEKKIGDTVIIKHSSINPETVQLKECYWNDNLKKKYGFNK